MMRSRGLEKKLEALTGVQVIPVWHLARGKDEFLRHCDEYGYVAIGGIVSGEIKPSQYKYFPWFIDRAHDKHSLIHGLGFTNMNCLDKFHFDSVDSTAWLSGGRFGSFYLFHNGKMRMIRKPSDSKSKVQKINEHNLKEWIKFSEYAETHL